MLDLRQISKTFSVPEGDVHALENITLQVHPGEFGVVRGPRGSGKTTLLLVASGLLHPDGGSVRVTGLDPYQLLPNQRTDLRCQRIGFMSQHYHLAPYLNVFENILFSPSVHASCDARQRARELLVQFGLEHRALHVPSQLSVEEQQRTALARALLNEPHLILADDPTAPLNGPTTTMVLRYLSDYVYQGGAVLLVTESRDPLRFATRHFQLDRGRLSGAMYGSHCIDRVVTQEMADTTTTYRDPIPEKIGS